MATPENMRFTGRDGIVADRSLFLTGGTGFVGRRLLEGLLRGRAGRVRVLQRSPKRFTVSHDVEIVTGDLREPATYEHALRGCELIMHLGAVTGKAARADYDAANVEGTRSLVDAAVRVGVSRMVFMSSIAAKFPRNDAYHYARSKQQAETVVRESGLNYMIVRPTIILGAESPIWRRLRDLAGLPLMPVIGDGTARVQPIDVDDVVAALVALVDLSPLPNRAVDLGGPDVVTFEELLRKIRRARRGDDSGVIHLPARPMIRVLTAVENWALPILPVTAGQLAAFVHDTVAGTDPPAVPNRSHMKTVDEIVRRLTSDG